MTIPADIEKKAAAYGKSWFGTVGKDDSELMAAIVADLLSEERERCAQIAENAVDYHDDGLSTFDAAQVIASAIRNEGEQKT